MISREEEMLAGRIIPTAQELRLNSEKLYHLVDCAVLEVASPVASEICQTIIDECSRRFWNIKLNITCAPLPQSMSDESYKITISQEKIQIEAADENAIRHAMNTLRQLAETERGVAKFSCYILPAVTISDAPRLAFRGLHICQIPETPVWELEKEIRLAAYYKFNYVVMEFWGTLRFKSHPELCWSEYGIEQSQVKALLKVAQSLGVTLIPQINLFGHASFSRCGSGKHALLDFHPEYASLFEPDGWSWCLSNPATRQYLTDLVLEIHELFDSPKYFHIGCDEAYNAASCTLCRRGNLAELLKSHLLYFHELLAKRGARLMMWHDMLLNVEDKKYHGYIVCGHEANHLDKLYQELPKDIIICDWQYGYPKKDDQEPTWPTSKFFKNNGFEVLVCPWIEPSGTLSLGKFAAENQLKGMLCTSWNINHSHYMFRIFYCGANGAWNPFYTEYPALVYREFFNRHLREIHHDMGITKYIQTGSVQYQINPTDYQQG